MLFFFFLGAGYIDPRRIAFYFTAPLRSSYLISDRSHPQRFSPLYRIL